MTQNNNNNEEYTPIAKMKESLALNNKFNSDGNNDPIFDGYNNEEDEKLEKDGIKLYQVNATKGSDQISIMHMGIALKVPQIMIQEFEYNGATKCKIFSCIYSEDLLKLNNTEYDIINLIIYKNKNAVGDASFVTWGCINASFVPKRHNSATLSTKENKKLIKGRFRFTYYGKDEQGGEKKIVLKECKKFPGKKMIIQNMIELLPSILE